jgi:hypothetical protein
MSVIIPLKRVFGVGWGNRYILPFAGIHDLAVYLPAPSFLNGLPVPEGFNYPTSTQGVTNVTETGVT